MTTTHSASRQALAAHCAALSRAKMTRFLATIDGVDDMPGYTLTSAAQREAMHNFYVLMLQEIWPRLGNQIAFFERIAASGQRRRPARVRRSQYAAASRSTAHYIEVAL